MFGVKLEDKPTIARQLTSLLYMSLGNMRLKRFFNDCNPEERTFSDCFVIIEYDMTKTIPYYSSVLLHFHLENAYYSTTSRDFFLQVRLIPPAS